MGVPELHWRFDQPPRVARDLPAEAVLAFLSEGEHPPTAGCRNHLVGRPLNPCGMRWQGVPSLLLQEALGIRHDLCPSS